MSQLFFSPTGDCHEVSFSTVAANTVIIDQTVTSNTGFKIDNSSGNLCFVQFGTSQAAVANVAHPTPGVGNAEPVIAVRTGETLFVNPGLGTYTGNVWIGTVSISGSGNIFIQSGV